MVARWEWRGTGAGEDGVGVGGDGLGRAGRHQGSTATPLSFSPYVAKTWGEKGKRF
jgi:hypothetical protein